MSGNKTGMGRNESGTNVTKDVMAGKTTAGASLRALRRNVLPSLLIVALVQSLALGWMVYDRLQLLKTGRQIVLPIVPVDPRSLFRGYYVRLGYPISRVEAGLLRGPAPAGNNPVYVTLQKTKVKAQAGETAGQKGSEDWKVVALRAAYEKPGRDDQIVLLARSRNGRPFRWRGGRKIFLRYGIERYYLQEGSGPRLEQLARDKKLAALIAVDEGGKAAIKGLMIDGKLQYEEPLF